MVKPDLRDIQYPGYEYDPNYRGDENNLYEFLDEN